MNTKNVLSLKKFFFLNVITLGAYQIYWGWKYWEIVKRAKKEKLHTGVRGFFIVFISVILSLAKKHGYKETYSPSWLAGGFLILNVLNNLIVKNDSIDFTMTVVITAIFIVLITSRVYPVINAMNYYLQHSQKDKVNLNFKHNYPLIIILIIYPILLGILEFLAQQS
jgi:hypothetical protein